LRLACGDPLEMLYRREPIEEGVRAVLLTGCAATAPEVLKAKPPQAVRVSEVSMSEVSSVEWRDASTGEST